MHISFLINVVGVALLLCAALLIFHHHLLTRSHDASTLIIIVCLGWSIAGPLVLTATATMLIAKENMDAAYREKPLVLWRLVEGQKRKPEATISLTAGLPAHFRAEMDDCHNVNRT